VVTSRRRRVLEGIWVALTVGYAIGRAFVVGHVFGKHGVNPWAYGTIDVVTSIPLGIATARAVGAAIDHRWPVFRRWAFVAAAAFIAPDLYIVIMGRHIPIHVYAVLGIYIGLTTTLTLRSGWKRIRAGHHDRGHAAGPGTLERV
jgi:hypothetical protein